MSFFSGEQESVKAVVDAGKTYGYGNMIDRLKVAWMLHLADSGLEWDSAALASGMDMERAIRIKREATKDEAALRQWIQEYICQSVQTPR